MTTSSSVYLNRLHLQNFKSIKGPYHLDLAPITLLFGPNSAGKSAVLAAIRQVGALCRAGDPIPFISQLRRAQLNHDYRQNMVLGVSAVFSSIPLPSGTKSRSSITDSFAAQFPCLVTVFYSKSEVQTEIGVKFIIEFDQEKETNISWIVLDQELAFERDLFGISWATEISVNSILYIVLTPSVLYINQDHPIIKGLDAELAPIGYTLKTLNKIFWGEMVFDGFLTGATEIEFRAGELTVDDKVILDGWDNELPFEEFRRLYFLLRSLQNFLIHTPLDLVANAVDNLLHLGPVRKIPKQHDVTFLARDLFVYSNIRGESEWHWSDASRAWYSIARDFNERLEKGHISSGDNQPKEKKDGTLSSSDLKFLSRLMSDVEYREKYRENEKQRDQENDSHQYPGIAVTMINDWLCSPQRLGLKHRLSVTFSEQNSTFFYPAVDILESDETKSIPQRVIVLRLIDESLSMPVNFNEVGAGIPQIIPVIAAGLISKQSFIEQPELHLHPKLQTETGDFFTTCMNRYGHRFILETHSEHLALRLLRRIRETTNAHIKHLDYQLQPKDVAFFYFDPQADGTAIVELRVSADGEFIDRWPRGFFSEREAEIFDEDD